MDFVPDPYKVIKLKNSLFELWMKFNCVTNTNETAEFHVKNGYSKNFIISADEQLNGKGRKKRIWISPNGGCYVTFSFFVEENEPYSIIPMIAGCAVYETLIKYKTSKNWAVKWPNDILYFYNKQYRKISGILCEKFEYEGKTVILIGIGINISGDFISRDDLLQPAISLNEICEKKYNSDEIISCLIEEIIKKYEFAKTKGFSELIGSMGNIFLQNKKIEISQNNEKFEAIIKGIANDGSLIIKTNGKEKKIYSADITIK